MEDRAAYANALTVQCSASSKDIYLQRAPDCMSDRAISVEPGALEELLRDPIMTKVVGIVNLASLSILELLEYDLSQRDINRALSKGVITFDRSARPPAVTKGPNEANIRGQGDYYFGFLNSKVRLSDLGIYVLKITEGRSSPVAGPIKKPE